MSYLKLSMSGGEVSLYQKADTKGLVINVYSVIARRLEMQYLTTHSMVTMHYVPQLDRKLLRYGVSWIVAISASIIGVAAYA
jgi:hypothetical protein